MEEPKIDYQVIGTVHSPCIDMAGLHGHRAGAEDADGYIEVFPEFQALLQALTDSSAVFVLYDQRQASGALSWARGKRITGQVASEGGVSSLPGHPNPIGLSVCRVVAMVGSMVRVRPIDIPDGAAVLDIRPCIAQADGAWAGKRYS